MPAVNFPSSPTNGQTFTSGGKTYTFNGTGWILGYADNTAGLTKVSTTPPTSPVNGDIWIDSNTMTQYAYYSDGSSSQWVEVSASVKPAITATTAASRPAASLAGVQHLSTDTSRFSIDTGSAWVSADLGAWTSFTPTWTGSVTNPTIGNGVLSGAYCQIGKFVQVRIRVQMGSTTTYGSSGYWKWNVPVDAVAMGQNFNLGNVYGYVGGSEYYGSVTGDGSAVVVARTAAGNLYGPGQPGTYASGAQVSLYFSYEAA